MNPDVPKWECDECREEFEGTMPDAVIITAGRLHKYDKDCYDEGFDACFECVEPFRTAKDFWYRDYPALLTPLKDFRGTVRYTRYHYLQNECHGYVDEKKQNQVVTALWENVFRYFEQTFHFYNRGLSSMKRHISLTYVDNRYQPTQSYIIENPETSQIAWSAGKSLRLCGAAFRPLRQGARTGGGISRIRQADETAPIGTGVMWYWG